MFKSLQQRK